MGKRVAALTIGLALAVAWSAPAARATTAEHSRDFVGRYRITAFPSSAPEFHTTWHVHADGTVVDHGLVAHWSNQGDVFTMTYSVGGTTEVLTGVRTARGISRAKKPATVMQDGVLTGTWFGRKLPPKR